MCALTNTISIEVGTDVHAVSMGTGAEWRGVEADGTMFCHISIASADVRNLPDKNAMSSLDIKHILMQTNLINSQGILSEM